MNRRRSRRSKRPPGRGREEAKAAACRRGGAKSNKKLWFLPAAAVVLALFALTLLACIHVRGLGAADDAFITFRMARNLAEGHGLRFNPDGPPVEAASNFLLTVTLAGAHRLGLSLIQTSAAIGVVAAVLTLLLLSWCAWRRAGPAGLLAPAGLATMYLLARNVTNGLETSLFTLLLFCATVVYVEAEERRSRRRALLLLSSLLCAVVALTRPEGPVYIIALGLVRLADLIKRRRLGQPLDLRTELYWAAGFAALYLPYTLWRLSYFGALLPNTYHAKAMQFDELSKLHAGAAYLVYMLLKEPLVPLGILAGAVSHWMAPSRTLRALLALTVAQCLFMLLSGGDWPHMFGYGRFLLPAVPLSLWILVEAGARLLRLRRRVAVAGAVVALTGLSQVDLVSLAGIRMPIHYHYQTEVMTRQALHQAYLVEPDRLPPGEWLARSTQTFSLDRYHQNFDAVVGMWLRDHYGPDTRIASIQAGQFAFWCEMPFFDMFGLVTPEVTRLDDYEPAKMAELIRSFNPRLIAFYKWNQGVHHRPLVLHGHLQEAGYGLRYVFVRESFRAFVVFEKGYVSDADPHEVLFSTMEDLPRRINRDRLIAALDLNHPEP
jgi:hypothetical protein